MQAAESASAVRAAESASAVRAAGARVELAVAVLTRQPRGPGREAARQQLDRVAAAAVAPLL